MYICITLNLKNMAKKPSKPKKPKYKASIENCRNRKGCMATSFEEMKTNIKIAA